MPVSLQRSSLLALAATGLVVAGCGSSNTNASSSSAPAAPAKATTTAVAASSGTVLRLSVPSGGGLRFNRSTLHVAKPGKVTLHLTNPSSAGMNHGIAIDGKGVDKDGKIVAPGKVSTVTVTLKKGKYTFYCPVPGHEQAGMKGTLTVA
jgi:uncharacterized cupredoxin-like copper-binding protein